MISGTNGTQLIQQMQLSELEREIVRGKQLSPVVYRYNSPEDLRFELAMRQSIVNAAKALYASNAAFAIFEKSRCNERYWTRTSDGGFRLKSGVRPADGIRDIYWNGRLYAFECATAIVIVWYKAVLDVIGDGAFNTYFTNLFLRDWHHDSDLWLISMQNKEEAYPGDVQYFKNPGCHLNTPEWRGENAVRLNGNLFFGHGIGINTGEVIIAVLNRKRRPGSFRSAYLTDLVVFPNFDYLRKLMARIYAEMGITDLGPTDQRHDHSIVAVIGSRTVER